MSDRVREAFEALIEQMEQPPTWEQLRSPIARESLRVRMRPRFRLRGAWVAGAVFVGVLLIGGLTWILQSGSPPVADQPVNTTNWDLMVNLPVTEEADLLVSQIEAISGVVDAEYFPDVRNLESAEPSNEDFDIAAVLLRLENPESAKSVATAITNDLDEVFGITYSGEIAESEADAYFEFGAAEAIVLSEDPLVLQPAQGPEPQFDVSSLGAGLTLTPAVSTSEIPDTFLSQAQAPRMGTDVFDADRPVIHVGNLEEIETRLIVYGTESGGYCAWADGGTACGDFSSYPFGVVLVGTSSPGDGHVAVRVPESTSVVALTVDESETLWQTPRAGWALFPLTVREPTLFTTAAYDVSGTLIGEWEQAG